MLKVLVLILSSVFCDFALSDELGIYQKTKLNQSLRKFILATNINSDSKIIRTTDRAGTSSEVCYLSGWVTSKNTAGECVSALGGSSLYNDYPECEKGKIRCNPALYGFELCIDDKLNSTSRSQNEACENAYREQSISILDFVDEVSNIDLDPILKSTHDLCSSTNLDSNQKIICDEFKYEMSFIVPQKGSEKLDLILKNIEQDKLDEAYQDLVNEQNNFSEKISSFEKECAEPMADELSMYCTNQANYLLKAQELIPKALSAMELKLEEVDCTKQEELMDKVVPPTCSQEEIMNSSKKCSDEVLCTIGSTAISSIMPGILTSYENLNLPKSNCIAAQNDCLTNFISTTIKSLVGLVTGIWDLLGMGYDWASDKVKDFWKRVWSVENETTNKQLILSQMSNEDIKEVKNSPIDWIKKVTSGLWESITEWIKEDIFCQKWEGTPRLSKCIEPYKELACLGCRTMIAGTCSVAGVVAGELLPALITGGGVNLAGRGAKGAGIVAKIVKGSKAYKKIDLALDTLKEVKVIQRASEAAKMTYRVGLDLTRPTRAMVKIGIKGLKGKYKLLLEAPRFKALARGLDFVAKYSGIKAFAKLNEKMYEFGYRFVDNIAEKSTISKTTKLIEAEKYFNNVNKELSAIDFSEESEFVNELRRKGKDYRELQEKLEILEKSPDKSLYEAKKKLLKKLEREITNDSDVLVHKIKEKLDKAGIDNKITIDPEDGLKIDLVFDSNMTKNKTVKFLKKIKDKTNLRSVTLGPRENIIKGSSGFFSGSEKRLEMGVNFFDDFLKGKIDYVSRHESRHAIFYSMRRRGQDSIYHLNFRSNGKVQVNGSDAYKNYMSAEELYTHSTDMQSFARDLKNLKDLDSKNAKGLLELIKRKNVGLISLTENLETHADESIEAIKNLMKEPKITSFNIKKSSIRGYEVKLKGPSQIESTFNLVNESDIELIEDINRAESFYLEKSTKYVTEKIKQEFKDKSADVVKKMRDGLLSASEKEKKAEIELAFTKSPEGVALNNQISISVKKLGDTLTKKLEKVRDLATDRKSVV